MDQVQKMLVECEREDPSLDANKPAGQLLAAVIGEILESRLARLERKVENNIARLDRRIDDLERGPVPPGIGAEV
jgi:hypothetical protein